MWTTKKGKAKAFPSVGFSRSASDLEVDLCGTAFLVILRVVMPARLGAGHFDTEGDQGSALPLGFPFSADVIDDECVKHLRPLGGCR